MSPELKQRLVQGLGVASGVAVMGYFVGFALAFQPGFEAWARFFVPRVLFIIYVPVVLLILYFFSRVQLGRWLLEQDALDAARGWCEPRLEANFWLRGKREALIQRVVLAQVLLRQLEYEAAREVLWPADVALPERANELLELARWRMEWALRMDDLLLAREAFGQAEEQSSPRAERASLLACMAEVELRSHADAARDRFIEEARWLDPTSRRARLVEVFALARDHTGDVGAAQRALDELDMVMPRSNELVPGRAVELLVLRARLLTRLERTREADDAIEYAVELVEKGRADRRSRFILEEELGRPVAVAQGPGDTEEE